MHARIEKCCDARSLHATPLQRTETQSISLLLYMLICLLFILYRPFMVPYPLSIL